MEGEKENNPKSNNRESIYRESRGRRRITGTDSGAICDSETTSLPGCRAGSLVTSTNSNDLSDTASGEYATIDDNEVVVHDETIYDNSCDVTDDDITIIDHSNPQQKDMLKWMRRSLRKITIKSQEIQRGIYGDSCDTGIHPSEPDSSNDILYDNLGNRDQPKVQSKSKPVDPLIAVSCRHGNCVLKLNCKTCSKIICDICMQDSHFGHDIESIQTAVKRLSDKVNDYLSQLSTSTHTFQSNIETVIAAENTMRQGYIEMEAIVKSTAEGMIMKIQEDRDNLLEEITTHQDSKLSQTQSIKKSLNVTVNQLTNKFSDSYEAFREGADSGNIEMVDIIQNTINPDENKQMIWAKLLALQNPIIKDHYVKMHISDTVSKIHDLTLVSSIGVVTFDELLPIPIHYPSNIRLHTSSLDKIFATAKLQRYSMGEKFTLPTDLKSNRIFIVRGNFWFPRKQKNSIEVYTPQGELKTSLSVPLIEGPNTLLQSTPNEVLVGYSSKDSGGLTALHIPLLDELVVKSTTNVFFGMVTELSMEGNTLVVLSATEGIVSVIQVNRETNIWHTTGAFSVPHRSKASMDTVLVNNSLIYVCSWVNDMVSVFDTQGNPMNELSFWNKLSTIGKKLNFCKFRLCMIDSHNCLLLCDKVNDTFQICSSDGRWKSFKLTGVNNPMDIVILSDQEFWVMHGTEPNCLKQFVANM